MWSGFILKDLCGLCMGIRGETGAGLGGCCNDPGDRLLWLKAEKSKYFSKKCSYGEGECFLFTQNWYPTINNKRMK